MDRAINMAWGSGGGEADYNAVVAYMLLGASDKACSLAEKSIPVDSSNVQVSVIHNSAYKFISFTF